MTKLKSKKMTKSTLAIIIMGIAIVALLAFGGSFAYFTASTTAKTVTLTTGKITLTNGSTYGLTRTVMPGDKIFEASDVVFSTAADDGDSYVAIMITVTIGGESKTIAELNTAFSFNITPDPNHWEETGTGTGIFVYKVASGNYTVQSTTAQSLAVYASDVTFDVDENCVDADVASTTFMNKTIVITMKGYALQADNVTIATANASNIWTAMDGELTTNSVSH